MTRVRSTTPGPSAPFDVLFCPDCRDWTPAEEPPCADGHGAACPDRACAHCGAAVTVDVALGVDSLVSPRRVAA